MPYCKHDRNIKGGQKKVAFLCRFFRPTSDVNISKSVYPIYLKIKVQRVPTSHSWHIEIFVFMSMLKSVKLSGCQVVKFDSLGLGTSDVNISETGYQISLKIDGG